MGNPALYVIRRPGVRKLDVRYARFGAPFLVGELAHGPVHLEAVAAAAEPSPWEYDGGVEAAVVVCLRTKRLGVTSTQLDALDFDAVRRIFAPAWPGYEIHVAERLSAISPLVGANLLRRLVRSYGRPRIMRGQREYQLGMPRLRGFDHTTDLGTDFRKRARSSSAWRRPHEDAFRFHGVLTLVQQDGAVDYLADAEVLALLHLGPDAVAWYDRLPTVTEAECLLTVQHRILPTGYFDLRPHLAPPAHALVDVPGRRLVVTVETGPLEGDQYGMAHAVAHAWEGWALEVQLGGVAAHYARLGRAPHPALAPPPETRLSAGATVARLAPLVLEAAQRKAEAASFLERAAVVVDGLFEEQRAKYPDSEVVVTQHAPVDPSQVPAPPLDEEAAVRARWEELVARSGLPATELAVEPADVAGLMYSAYDFRHDAAAAREQLAALFALEPGHRAGRHLALALTVALGPREALADEAAAVLAVAPDDAFALAVQALCASPVDLDGLERAFDREPSPLVGSWLASKLLARAEAEPDPAGRRELLARARRTTARCPYRTSDLAWCDACAESLLEEDAERAWALVTETLQLGEEPRAELAKKLLADPQLAWLWSRKGQELPEA
jgi:hypothetical protein